MYVIRYAVFYKKKQGSKLRNFKESCSASNFDRKTILFRNFEFCRSIMAGRNLIFEMNSMANLKCISKKLAVRTFWLNSLEGKKIESKVIHY